MPRGKTKTIAVLLNELELKKAEHQKRIENYKAKIAQLDSEIKNLKDAQKQKELEKLMDLIKASGKTPEEVISSLRETG
ncbi:MAG: cortexillin II [Clostridiales bacterium]|jgi:phosphopantetheine adenylyltransferase|nr:cortexillin II [Clostridiales bacterium]